MTCAAPQNGTAPGVVRTGGNLWRVLGFYIAGAAGVLQLLDILVDRAGLQLSSDFFLSAVIVGVVGIPVVGAATALCEVAMAERRQPPARAGGPSAGERPHTAVRLTVRHSDAPAREAHLPGDGPEPSGEALRRHLELALSYRRLSQLCAENGDAESARAHEDAWQQEVISLIAQLRQAAGDKPIRPT